MRIILGLGIVVTVFASTARAQEKTKIAVVPTQLEESAKGMVPSLFDDYLLTAVQNTSGAQVIGQDDIGAMLGFDKQKQIMNCDDTACMADIGGALGVDKIVSVKIARLGDDWVATAKLINIKATKVEARVNEIVPGDTKALLKAVPRLTGKLFGQEVAESSDSGGVASRVEPTKTAAVKDPPAKSNATSASGPDSKFGRGPRIAGTVMLLAGGGLAILGGLWATSLGSCTDTSDDYSSDYYDSTYEDDCTLESVYLVYSAFFIIVGEVLAGVGAKLRANGTVRQQLASNDVSGSPTLYWLGWVLAGVTIATPFLGIAGAIDQDQAQLLGWGCGLGSLAVFLIGGFTASPKMASLELPLEPTVAVARDGDGRWVPTYGLGFTF
jgi:hypothetical protein